MAADIFFLLYMAFAKGIGKACCVFVLSCQPQGPMPDGCEIPADSCTKPTVQLHCDCEKFPWRKR